MSEESFLFVHFAFKTAQTVPSHPRPGSLFTHLRIFILDPMSLRNRNMHKDADIYADEYIFGDRDIFSNIDRGIGKGKFKVGRACPKVDEKLIEDESIDVPLKLLHEGEGHGVTVELKNGDVCRGKLIESENNWTLQLDTANFVFRKTRHKIFSRTGKEVKLDSIFIRGRRIKG
ncbi:uncharacterized protein [Physcomitrium patens]|uniref:uncharacterized protein isoform X2 n=1 Tax=Physcomitrium patens TaxID=3218 RepID=UPI000D16110E|nr:uncharacterized protein LOC112287486 isoform X2 [Physcomitrium patens]|eukprot:XP_024386282.1 uncharacterized protein LOC112287486 isoform X2 [Physcomitrella patens]